MDLDTLSDLFDSTSLVGEDSPIAPPLAEEIALAFSSLAEVEGWFEVPLPAWIGPLDPV